MDTLDCLEYVIYPTGTKQLSYTRSMTTSDPYFGKRVSHDEMLHETLTKIFQECCGGQDSKINKIIQKHNNSEHKRILKLLLEHRPSLALVLPQKATLSLLWIAVLRCYQKTAELLVRSGADVNERCEYKVDNFITKNTTILHILLQMFPSSWNEQFIALVIDKGADLQTPDSNGKTIVHLAVIHGRVDITKMLLEKGADVNAADNDGEIPLLAAAIHSKADKLVPLLVKHGADVGAKCGIRRMNALHWLTDSPYFNKTNGARLLIEHGVSLNEREVLHNYQPIHMAAVGGKNRLVKLYLDHGADVNSRANGGVTPLHLAAGCKNPEVLITLLKRGANIDLRSDDGRTALHEALHEACNHWEYSNNLGENIKILIFAGADVCIEDETGRTPYCVLNYLPNNDDFRENNFDFYIYNIPRIWYIVLKFLALKKACLQPSIELKDEILIKNSSKYWNYYQDCAKQINIMKSTRFFNSWTLFDLLTKCHCQMAALMSNPKFEINFRLCDFKVLPAYDQGLRKAFDCVERHHLSMVKQEDVINEALYNCLPYVVVHKIIEYLCDECVLKKIL